MAEFLVILSYGFSIWMFVDALRRKAEFYWFVIIIFLMPIGAIAYFVVVKLPTSKMAQGGCPQGPRSSSAWRPLDLKLPSPPSKESKEQEHSEPKIQAPQPRSSVPHRPSNLPPSSYQAGVDSEAKRDRIFNIVFVVGAIVVIFVMNADLDMDQVRAQIESLISGG